MKKLLFIYFFLISSYVSLAQGGRVSGKVSDEDGIPLAGVNIIVKGTKTGVMSDGDGNYSISPKSFPAVLSFSFLGMETEDISVKKPQENLSVTMKASGLAIEQTVITGYTQTNVKKITGSVGVLTAKNLEEQAKSSIDAMLQGQLAGARIVLADCGLTEDARALARYLAAREKNACLIDGEELKWGETP